jgi:hypothetical protein
MTRTLDVLKAEWHPLDCAQEKYAQPYRNDTLDAIHFFCQKRGSQWNAEEQVKLKAELDVHESFAALTEYSTEEQGVYAKR